MDNPAVLEDLIHACWVRGIPTTKMDTIKILTEKLSQK